jgi:hypothetical protein
MVTLILGLGLLLAHFVIRLDPFISAFKPAKEIFIYLVIFLTVFFYKPKFKIRAEIFFGLIFLLIFAYLNTEIFAQIYFWTQFQAVSMMILLFVIVSKSYIRRKILFHFIALSCVIESFWCLGESLDFDNYNFILNAFKLGLSSPLTKTFASGSLNQPNLSGAYIAISSAFLFNSWWIIFLPFAMFATIETSDLPVATFLFVLTVFMARRENKIPKKALFLAWLIPAILFLIFGFPNNLDNGRYPVWEAIIKNNDNYLLGNGLGHFAMFFHQTFLPEMGVIFRNAHSEILECYYDFGLLGLSLVSYLFYQIIKYQNNRILIASIFGIIFNCYGNFTFHSIQLSYLCVIILALSHKKNDRLDF